MIFYLFVKKEMADYMKGQLEQARIADLNPGLFGMS